VRDARERLEHILEAGGRNIELADWKFMKANHTHVVLSEQLVKDLDVLIGAGSVSPFASSQ
jgi:hypothetical protein